MKQNSLTFIPPISWVQVTTCGLTFLHFMVCSGVLFFDWRSSSTGAPSILVVSQFHLSIIVVDVIFFTFVVSQFHVSIIAVVVIFVWLILYFSDLCVWTLGLHMPNSTISSAKGCLHFVNYFLLQVAYEDMFLN